MTPILISKIKKTQLENLECIFSQKNKIYTFLNPVSYLIAFKNKYLFGRFDGIFADGSLLVFAIKLCYGFYITRKSFDMTSIAPMLFDFALNNKKTIYIVASQQEQVVRAIRHFKENYKGIQIVGFRNGFFNSSDEIDSEIHNIISVNPDFLIVGMGALSQEKFLYRAKELGFHGIGFTCGGFIHQISKNELEYYPKWINNCNIRFLYRMYKEKHTRKRYVQAAFIFPCIFIYEKIFGDKSNS